MKTTLELTATETAIIEYLRSAHFNSTNAMVVLDPDNSNTKLVILNPHADGFIETVPGVVAYHGGSIAIE